MKQMPYKIEEGAIERAKYRAKMAVREAAHPTENVSHRVPWRWASVAVAVVVVAIGVFGLAKFGDEIFRKQTPMERLIAEMQTASNDVIYELEADYAYYLEEENRL